MELICPRCEQDFLSTFVVPKTEDSGLICQECEAIWPAEIELPFPGFVDRRTFGEQRGLESGDLVVGPRTGESRPPANVRIRRRLPSRPHKPAPNEPPWGEVGGIRCPYCNGHLLNAEIPPGLRFSFCQSCEALWPQGEPLTPVWPTCLADFLDDHHATWDEVSNLGRRRE